MWWTRELSSDELCSVVCLCKDPSITVPDISSDDDQYKPVLCVRGFHQNKIEELLTVKEAAATVGWCSYMDMFFINCPSAGGETLVSLKVLADDFPFIPLRKLYIVIFEFPP